MPSGSVSDYAAVHAVVRSKYASILSSQKISELVDAPDLSAIVNLLKDTVYGPYMAKIDEKEITPRRVIYQMKSQVADDYQMVIRLAPSFARALLAQLFRHFEVDNLKAVLRSIVSGASWDQVNYVLFPLGSASQIPAQAMVDSRSIPSAIELLRGTAYYQTLSDAMDRYTAEKSLFPLEVALDLDYWRTLWNQVNQLTGRDHEYAVRIIGSLLDMNNLMWAIRYRVYRHLSEEEIINYTLPIGYHVHDEDIRAIAAGADIQQEVSRIYPNIGELDRLFQNLSNGLPELELNLQRNLMAVCKAAFAGYPFHIGIPLAYLVLKEMEIQNLTVLIEAKSSQMAAEGFQPYLLVGPQPK